jgi:hypothetical protein
MSALTLAQAQAILAGALAMPARKASSHWP